MTDSESELRAAIVEARDYHPNVGVFELTTAGALEILGELDRLRARIAELEGQLDVSRVGFVNEVKARVNAENELAKRDANHREVLEIAVGQRETKIETLRAQAEVAGGFIEKIRGLLNNSDGEWIRTKAGDYLDQFDERLAELDASTLDEVLASMAERCEVPNGPCEGCLQGAACDGMDTPDDIERTTEKGSEHE